MSIFEKPIGLKRYLTFSEVWEVYGIGRKTIAKYVRERQLRRRMVGKAWRYPVDDLERIFSADTRVSHGARRMRRGRSVKGTTDHTEYTEGTLAR